MAALRESPWYTQILEEGIEKGLEHGLEQGLERELEQGRKIGLNTQQLTRLAEAALDAASMNAFTKSFESVVYAAQID